MATKTKPKPGKPRTAEQTQIVAQTIANLRTQRFQAELTRDMNGHSDDDIHPERGLSYRIVLDELDNAEIRIAEKHAKLMPAVNEILKDKDA